MHLTMIPSWLAVPVAMGLLASVLWAMFSDLRSRRIPNQASAAIAAFWIVQAVCSGAVTDSLLALLGAAGVFAGGLLFWRFGWLGGGDVKLLAALSLWAGGPLLLPFLLLTTLLGGVLTLAQLSLARGAAMAIGMGAPGRRLSPALVGSGRPLAVPYGLAIGAAGLGAGYQQIWP